MTEFIGMLVLFLIFVFNWVMFICVSGVLGYFAIHCYFNGDYFFASVCAALFLKFILRIRLTVGK